MSVLTGKRNTLIYYLIHYDFVQYTTVYEYMSILDFNRDWSYRLMNYSSRSCEFNFNQIFLKKGPRTATKGNLIKENIAGSRFLERHKCNFLKYYVCTICFRRRYTSRAFILPVLIFTFLYNLPKFFELYVKENPITKVVECIDIIDEPNVYSNYLKNCTEDSISNITIPDFGKDLLLLKLAIIYFQVVFLTEVDFRTYWILVIK